LPKAPPPVPVVPIENQPPPGRRLPAQDPPQEARVRVDGCRDEERRGDPHDGKAAPVEQRVRFPDRRRETDEADQRDGAPDVRRPPEQTAGPRRQIPGLPHKRQRRPEQQAAGARVGAVVDAGRVAAGVEFVGHQRTRRDSAGEDKREGVARLDPRQHQ